MITLSGGRESTQRQGFLERPQSHYSHALSIVHKACLERCEKNSVAYFLAKSNWNIYQTIGRLWYSEVYCTSAYSGNDGRPRLVDLKSSGAFNNKAMACCTPYLHLIYEPLMSKNIGMGPKVSHLQSLPSSH